MNDTPDLINKLISTGSALAGAASGAALEFIAPDSYTAAAAGAAGVIIATATHTLGDLVHRMLSKRERVRIGAVASVALSVIEHRLEIGDVLREDDFFVSGENRLSEAEEIFEGVLLSAKNDHQEKKAHLLGTFFANPAFSPDVSIGEANYLLHVVETMTYRQLCFIAVLLKAELINTIPLTESELSDPGLESHPELASLLQEIYDIADLGLINRLSDDLRSKESTVPWFVITPKSMALSPLGLRLAILLDVNQIPLEDIEPITSLMHLDSNDYLDRFQGSERS